jgi:beta-lactamase class D
MKIVMRFFIVGYLLVAASACKRNNIKEQKEWSSIFKKYGVDSACFELNDNTHEQIFIYNIPRCSQRFSPASTFKIMLSLIGLETAVASDVDMVIPWNNVKSSREDWDKDMDMREAFKTSSEPYYKELASRVGYKDLKKYVDTVKYGNMVLGNDIQKSWTNDSLQITADEQVGMLKKLYNDKLPFSQRTQRLVRSLMLQEKHPTYNLYYKTGTKSINDKTLLAWIVGYVEKIETQKGVMSKKIETNYRPYEFACNFEIADDTTKDIKDILSIRPLIVKDVLRTLSIIPSTD